MHHLLLGRLGRTDPDRVGPDNPHCSVHLISTIALDLTFDHTNKFSPVFSLLVGTLHVVMAGLNHCNIQLLYVFLIISLTRVIAIRDLDYLLLLWYFVQVPIIYCNNELSKPSSDRPWFKNKINVASEHGNRHQATGENLAMTTAPHQPHNLVN